MWGSGWKTTSLHLQCGMSVEFPEVGMTKVGYSRFHRKAWKRSSTRRSTAGGVLHGGKVISPSSASPVTYGEVALIGKEPGIIFSARHAMPIRHESGALTLAGSCPAYGDDLELLRIDIE